MFDVTVDDTSECPECEGGVTYAKLISYSLIPNDDETEYMPSVTVSYGCTHCELIERDIQRGEMKPMQEALTDLKRVIDKLST